MSTIRYANTRYRNDSRAADPIADERRTMPAEAGRNKEKHDELC
jgi:hypothetical protein